MWNLVSGEFRRSTSVDAAAEMLATGEWLELQVLLEKYEAQPIVLTQSFAKQAANPK